MKPGESKYDKRAIKDEADATEREGERQAGIERRRASARICHQRTDRASGVEDVPDAIEALSWDMITAQQLIVVMPSADPGM